MDDSSLKFIGIGVTMLGGGIGAGIGIGTVIQAWLNSISRNPAADAKMKLPGFLGFAGTELILLLSFVVVFLLLGAK